MVTQAQIDQLKWYHDFDFPGNLRARMTDRENAAYFRLLWSFIHDQTAVIDVRGKSVLDVGCWDGYFSFLAEERGAARVLAVDDFSQNWGSTESFMLARTLKNSSVELMPDVSVYRLSERIREQFDVIFFFGVYYHLYSPFHALSELRARCHEQSLVLIEGEHIPNEAEAFARYRLDQPRLSKFVPTTRLLCDLLHASYFEVKSIARLGDLELVQKLKRSEPQDLLRVAAFAVKRKAAPSPAAMDLKTDHIFIVAQPFVRKNSFHQYKPPFGLAQFDPRWAE